MKRIIYLYGGAGTGKSTTATEAKAMDAEIKEHVLANFVLPSHKVLSLNAKSDLPQQLLNDTK